MLVIFTEVQMPAIFSSNQFFSFSFIFILWSDTKDKSTNWILMFCLIRKTKSDLLIQIWWSISFENPRELLGNSFSRTNSSFKAYHYYFIHLRVFHTRLNWLFLTRAWVVTSFFKSPGLFSVFWPILIKL